MGRYDPVTRTDAPSGWVCTWDTIRKPQPCAACNASNMQQCRRCFVMTHIFARYLALVEGKRPPSCVFVTPPWASCEGSIDTQGRAEWARCSTSWASHRHTAEAQRTWVVVSGLLVCSGAMAVCALLGYKRHRRRQGPTAKFTIVSQEDE
jgi:hypothetical protein